MDGLNKIYVEPTNRCNLACVTWIRHAWDELFGDMEWTTYQALIDGLSDFPGAKTIAFAGLGEPLLHERFSEMIQLAHESGFRTEMTSNAMLLTPSLAANLIEAGLDQLVVSIDGAAIGALTGVIGLGGGYALVPSFIYLFKAPMKLAIGTSMASFVWMALVGAIFKLYQNVVNIPVAVTLGIGALIGAIDGAKLVTKFKPAALKFLFGLLFLYVSLKYILIYFGVAI